MCPTNYDMFECLDFPKVWSEACKTGQREYNYVTHLKSNAFLLSYEETMGSSADWFWPSCLICFCLGAIGGKTSRISLAGGGDLSLNSLFISTQLL
jgi:hypothetical protein